jgi:replicative superfamily II helicase
VSDFPFPLAELPGLNQVAVPDLWQQQAVAALREGKDVVVQAPTGAGKTLIFELWSNQGKNRGQAIYTVPTRALANDKLAEWRARGWDVGIATGDLAENLNAPVVVATLETQKDRLIQGDGPALLVVDEYQMLSDPDRGLNYELAIALAPLETQLLLLSGSVANPQDLVKWFQRLGRKAVLIRHEQRPVPLEEIYANNLNFHLPSEIKGYWPRLVAKSLAEDLGPVLVFSPRRQAAEQLAADLARQLPIVNPLQLSTEQKLVVGEHLAKLLKTRVASGSSSPWPRPGNCEWSWRRWASLRESTFPCEVWLWRLNPTGATRPSKCCGPTRSCRCSDARAVGAWMRRVTC